MRKCLTILLGCFAVSLMWTLVLDIYVVTRHPLINVDGIMQNLDRTLEQIVDRMDYNALRNSTTSRLTRSLEDKEYDIGKHIKKDDTVPSLYDDKNKTEIAIKQNISSANAAANVSATFFTRSTTKEPDNFNNGNLNKMPVTFLNPNVSSANAANMSAKFSLHIPTKVHDILVTGNSTKVPPTFFSRSPTKLPAKLSNESTTKVPEKFFTRRPTRVPAYPYKSVINEPSACPRTKSFPLLIMVTSAVNHLHRRLAVRASWAGYREMMKLNVVVVFLLGVESDGGGGGAAGAGAGGGRHRQQQQQVQQESASYHDILQDDFLDTYDTLPTKSLMALHWAVTSCPTARFMFKTDDDIVLNVAYVLSMLTALENTTNVLLGAPAGGGQVFRRGKWEVSPQLYPYAHYKPYLSGAAYVMSLDVARAILEAADFYPLIRIEDVYITGILSNIAGISPLGHDRFPQWLSRGEAYICKFSRGGYVGVHASSIKTFNHIWKRFEEKVPCTLPDERR